VNSFQQLQKARMIKTPARATGPTKDFLFPSATRPAQLNAPAVFPSYFASEIQISRETLRSDTPRGNGAESHFASQASLPSLARRVA
jgi:hypothetical protein